MVEVSKPIWSCGADGARISLLVPTTEAAVRLCDQFKEGKRYQMEVKELRKKRSLDANALMWVLLGEMCEILQGTEPGIDPVELYRRYITHTPNYVVMEIWDDDLPRLYETWGSNGLGWICQKMDVVEEQDGMQKSLVRLFYGSSQYDAKQMAALIDSVLQDANAIGVDTSSESFRELRKQYPEGQ